MSIAQKLYSRGEEDPILDAFYDSPPTWFSARTLAHLFETIGREKVQTRASKRGNSPFVSLHCSGEFTDTSARDISMADTCQLSKIVARVNLHVPNSRVFLCQCNGTWFSPCASSRLRANVAASSGNIVLPLLCDTRAIARTNTACLTHRAPDQAIRVYHGR